MLSWSVQRIIDTSLIIGRYNKDRLTIDYASTLAPIQCRFHEYGMINIPTHSCNSYNNKQEMDARTDKDPTTVKEKEKRIT
mmetsp:Transcript_14536/g.35294  ORF Transcript_14536/g.35294 Transcript_14536/m.35294 type:complete len:81 (+) Transcript_14536:3615-3857(+)